MGVEPQIAFLDAKIARYRAFASVPAAIFVLVITMTRFAGDVPSVPVFAAAISVSAAAYALLCASLALARLHTIKLSVLRSELPGAQQPVLSQSRDGLTRVISWPIWDGPRWWDWLMRQFWGFQPASRGMHGLSLPETVLELDEQLAGCEARTLLGTAASAFSLAALLFVYFQGLAG